MMLSEPSHSKYSGCGLWCISRAASWQPRRYAVGIRGRVEEGVTPIRAGLKTRSHVRLATGVRGRVVRSRPACTSEQTPRRGRAGEATTPARHDGRRRERRELRAAGELAGLRVHL